MRRQTTDAVRAWKAAHDISLGLEEAARTASTEHAQALEEERALKAAMDAEFAIEIEQVQ